MKKLLLPALLMFGLSLQSNSQTVATNFTATDCNANSHTLFTELDNGDVVVLAWVMPCAACVAPTKTAYSIAKGYNSKPGYAGHVKFYLIDDLGNHNCTYLSNWASNYNIGPDILTVFDNAPGGSVIDEDDYGGTGMPHIAIVGGTDHKIFFNKFNASANDPAGIESALYLALTPASVGGTASAGTKTTVFPNPAQSTLNVAYKAENTGAVVFEIIDITGRRVAHTYETYTPGVNNETIDVGHLANGTYFLLIKGNSAKETLKFNILR